MGVIIQSGTPDEETLIDVGPRIFIPVDEQRLPPVYSAYGTDPEVEKERKHQLKLELYWLRCSTTGLCCERSEGERHESQR
jgi:hypothetical protein